MIRNTWESILDLVTGLLGVCHDVVDIMYGVVEDIRNIGDALGSAVTGKNSDDDTIEIDWEEEDNEDLDEDTAELLKNVRKSKK